MRRVTSSIRSFLTPVCVNIDRSTCSWLKKLIAQSTNRALRVKSVHKRAVILLYLGPQILKVSLVLYKPLAAAPPFPLVVWYTTRGEEKRKGMKFIYSICSFASNPSIAESLSPSNGNRWLRRKRSAAC